METLRGRASKDVIAAFKNVLGEAQTSGSHYIFRAREGGSSYHIPYHGTRPVTFGILKRAFEVLNVSPVELVEEL